MNPIYITLDAEKVRVITRGEVQTKQLCEDLGTTHLPLSARLLQAIVARSSHGDEDMSEYNFREYQTLAEKSKQWSFLQNRYETFEEVEELEQELDRSLMLSDDEYDLKSPEKDFCFVEHIWTKGE